MCARQCELSLATGFTGSGFDVDEKLRQKIEITPTYASFRDRILTGGGAGTEEAAKSNAPSLPSSSTSPSPSAVAAVLACAGAAAAAVACSNFRFRSCSA